MKTKRYILGALSALIAFLELTSIVSAQPLVPTDWVKDNIGKPDLVLLDIREEALYRVRHAFRAINFPYQNDAWRVRPLTGVNPNRTQQLFNARMSELGIANNSHVVLIHAGRSALDVADAAHVYWYFKLMSHERISIMNGGMVAYLLDNGPIESLYRNLPTSDYQSKYNGELIARLGDVEAAVLRDAVFVDYRSTAFFLGISKVEEVARYGTIPGAKNMPADWLTVDGGGMIRSPASLRKIYELHGIPFALPHIAFSNTTERAALGWFVTCEILGNKNVRLYEASIREWAANPTNKMVRQIDLD